MKIFIGSHINWFGPYQLAEVLCFWVKPVEDEHGIMQKPNWVFKFGEWLAHGSIKPEQKIGDSYSLSDERKTTILYDFLSWIHSKKKRIHYIKIDKYDCWNIDATLSPIILPMLKELRINKHGSPFVDIDDVPLELRATQTEEYSDQKTFDFYLDDFPEIDYLTMRWDYVLNEMIFDDVVPEVDYLTLRWDYVLNEMIFAFESRIDESWRDSYQSGERDISWKCTEDNCSIMEIGPNDTYKIDFKGMQIVEDRIQNGFRLFGKYFQNLWD